VAATQRDFLRPPPDESRPVREAVAAAAQVAQAVLSLNVPEQVAPGKDFTVSVNLAGAENLPAADLELDYDTAQLEVLDEGEKSGVRQLKLGKGGGMASLTFKIIAQKSGTAQVGVRSVTFQADGEGAPPEVKLPPVANIEIR
jgi:general secretion pathway protein D